MTEIENIAIKRRVDVSLTNINIITYTAVTIFLPYILSTIILTFLALYILVNKQTRQLIFAHNGTNIIKVFFLYILVIPIVYRNWIGFVVGIGVLLAAVIGLYMRSVMTRALFERVLTYLCVCSLTSAGYAIIEKVIHLIYDGRSSQRISAVFFHPNYFGTIVGTIIIICAYKVLTEQEHKWFYYMTAFMNIISMYLCKSMFVWVEVFIGVAVLLFLFKRHRLLALWMFAAAAGGFMVFFLEVNIIPRLSDVEVTVRLRQQIWALAVEQIKKAPLFGHGFYSFIYLFHRTYRNQIIPHSHSIYLDLILNFGLIGTALIVAYLFKYFKKLFFCLKDKNCRITALILAVTAAALIHGITDITLLWVQTLPLFLLILSGLGVYEKRGMVSKSFAEN